MASLRGKSAVTVTNYTHRAAHFRPSLGKILPRDLTARDVAAALTAIAPEVSARTLRLIHQILERAIRHAEINDLVDRNVASLIKLSDLVVAGKPGRPSKSLTLAQAVAVLDAAAKPRLYAYVVLSLACGARTEELRDVTWANLDLEDGVLCGQISPGRRQAQDDQVPPSPGSARARRHRAEGAQAGPSPDAPQSS